MYDADAHSAQPRSLTPTWPKHAAAQHFWSFVDLELTTAVIGLMLQCSLGLETRMMEREGGCQEALVVTLSEPSLL